MKPGFIDHIGIRFGLGLMNESDFGTDKNNKDFRIIWPEHVVRLFECYYFLTFRIKIGSNVQIIIYAQSSKSRYFSDEIISPPPVSLDNSEILAGMGFLDEMMGGAARRRRPARRLSYRTGLAWLLGTPI